MRIFVSSDHHLLDGSRRDDFAGYEDEFIHSIDKIPPGSILVLNGDFIDIWRCPIGSILGRYNRLFNYLATCDRKILYIAGNHDRNISKLRSVLPDRFTICKHIVLDGILFTHGDIFDIVCGRFWKIGRAITRIANIVGTLSPRLEDWVEGLSTVVRATGRYGDVDNFERQACNFIEYFAGISGIVCGHTHVSDCTRMIGGKQYINTGTWKNDGWTVIDNGMYAGRIL